jgi:hypothetical protein
VLISLRTSMIALREICWMARIDAIWDLPDDPEGNV